MLHHISTKHDLVFNIIRNITSTYLCKVFPSKTLCRVSDIYIQNEIFVVFICHPLYHIFGQFSCVIDTLNGKPNTCNIFIIMPVPSCWKFFIVIMAFVYSSKLCLSIVTFPPQRSSRVPSEECNMAMLIVRTIWIRNRLDIFKDNWVGRGFQENSIICSWDNWLDTFENLFQSCRK